MDNHLKKTLQEKIELDINIGDEILAGRFKNKKVIVKDIGTDDKNQPTINGKAILKFRIKKLIKEEINKLFETLGFQGDSAQQIATNMALFKLPRKGMDDSINNFNQIRAKLDKEESQEEREEELDVNFKPTAPNIPAATVMTNIFEAKDIEESYGIYGSTEAAKKNLDSEKPAPPISGAFSQEAQDEFDLHNDNINRSLKEIPAGNSREGGVTNNKDKHW